MKIAVFGSSGTLNAGEERIQHALSRILATHTVVFLPHHLRPPLDYLKDFDWILIGGGILFERVGIFVGMKEWLRRTKANVGVVGLSVNSLTEMLAEEMEALSKRTAFFFVRDRESKSLLKNLPNVEVRPDLTWTFPYLPSSAQPSLKAIALNLAPCPWKDFHPREWTAKLNGPTILPFPIHFGRRRDFDLLSAIYPETPAEFSLSPIHHSETVIGCRYHAITAALQLRRPFIAINHDEKIERLTKSCKLQAFCLQPTESDLLPGKLQAIEENREELTRQIDEFAKQMEMAGHALREELRSHLATRNSRRGLFRSSSSASQA